MTSSSALVRRFLSEEVTPAVRELLKHSVADAVAQGAVVREFNFNVFDVKVDFDEGRVTVADVLEPDSSSTISLDAFITALEQAPSSKLEAS